ncbi:MAG: hypothetical protein CO148_05730 [Nitrospirae bacterium CG_4_9_14_3_um_filter_41_27]|nr:MAG: hypothetical protein CO148_05730 [Nitrospirae bacterium CG_4_9_14_3_um_filter_41_27]
MHFTCTDTDGQEIIDLWLDIVRKGRYLKMSNRQKLIAMVITCFMFVGVGNGVAGELQKHALELGPEISYIEYKEPGVMKENGWMYGIVGSYTYHDKLLLKAEGRLSYGWVDYSNSGTMDDIDDYIWELRGLGGYDFSVLKASILTPYIGIGYRYLNDDMSGRVSSTGALRMVMKENQITSIVP